MKKKKIFSAFTVECAIKIKERKSDKRETNKSKLELGKGTRADTLGIHLIFRPRDRKEQVVLRDVDASKTLVILETGANYSSSSPPTPFAYLYPPPSTTFRQLRLALFTLRPRPQPRPTTPFSLFLSSFSLCVASLLKLPPRMTAHRIVIPFRTAHLE